MRSHYLLIVLGLLVILAFVGCGDDTSAPTQQAGSDLDPEFIAVQGEVEYFVDSTLDFFLNGLNNLTMLAGEDELIDPVHYGPVYPDSDFVSTSYAYGWHVVTITRNRTNYAVQMRDSVQFYGDGEVPGVGQVQRTSSNADSLYYKHSWLYGVHDTTGAHSNFEGDIDLRLNGLQGTVATVNGQHRMMVQSKYVLGDSFAYRDFEIEADLTDFEISKTGSGWAQGCPNTGTATGTVQMTFTSGENAPVITTWSFTLSFTDGTMSATVRHGNTYWDYEADVCQAPAVVI